MRGGTGCMTAAALLLAALVIVCPLQWYFSTGTYFFCFKIFRTTHGAGNLIHIRIGNTGSPLPYLLAHQFRNTAFNIIDDFITAFFVGKIASQTLNIGLQLLVSSIFDRDDPATEVYVNNLFHDSGIWLKLVG